ncbi:MAG: ABC transporter transmembrane domain-containing protein [Curvibacter sp.]|jgi:ATP-binding cassette subfamily B protein|nr:ATP-binding cassette domain-containing protein [Curvibacter sp.]
MPASPRALSGLAPFLRPYRRLLAVAIVFLLLAAATTLAFPSVLRRLVDHGFASDASADQVALSFLYLFGLASALAVFSAGRYFTVSWLGERITADLRNAVYAHVLRQSPAFFETTQPGEVLSRLGNDTTLVQTVLSSSFSMGLRNLLMGTGALVMLIWTNPWLMLQVVTVLVAVILPSVYLGRRVRRLSRASQDRMADSSALASEVLHAIPVVQSHTAEARETSRFVEASRRSLRTALGRIRARSLLISFIIVASSAVLLWGLYRGTLAVHAGTSTAGQLGETVLYVMLLSSAFAVLGEVYGDLARAAGATERLMELLGSESSIQTVAQPVQPAWPSEGSTLQLEGVRFHYPSRPQSWAVDGLSATVSAGQTVAVVGPSGAGKTTLFDLLLRLYDPQSGRIVLDGAPIDQMSLQDLRARIAIVPQEPVIFSGTVSENIRYSRPEASMEEVKSAARAAYADRFITELPDGYDTDLGERGVRLSGGQRQRIAIARAILKGSPLLLLDEATSALDAQSEQMVQSALAQAMVGRTTLVIAHRLATVQRADVIWVLDRGRLVEQGSHAELLVRGGLYASLAALQFGASR